jgi:DNA-binding LytR/AlgR family response regulator
LLYSSWTIGFSLSFNNILVFQIYTLAVGILPITTLTLVKQNYLKKRNETNAELLSHSLSERRSTGLPGQFLGFSSDNARESLRLDADHVLYIKAEGNYITIGYIKNGKISRTMLRNTMKYASDMMIPYPFLYQCHRSWIVNLCKVKKISGNSQGFFTRIYFRGSVFNRGIFGGYVFGRDFFCRDLQCWGLFDQYL